MPLSYLSQCQCKCVITWLNLHSYKIARSAQMQDAKAFLFYISELMFCLGREFLLLSRDLGKSLGRIRSISHSYNPSWFITVSKLSPLRMETVFWIATANSWTLRHSTLFQWRNSDVKESSSVLYKFISEWLHSRGWCNVLLSNIGPTRWLFWKANFC